MSTSTVTEWQDTQIETKIRECANFRKGIVNLFFEGSTVPIISEKIKTGSAIVATSPQTSQLHLDIQEDECNCY